MSARKRFLEKLASARTPSSVPPAGRAAANTAAFRQAMAQLQAHIAGWLDGTGISVGTTRETLTDLLLPGGKAEVPGLCIRCAASTLTVTPLFLYGPGVAGCAEVSLRAEGGLTLLARLFLPAGRHGGWQVVFAGQLPEVAAPLGEEAFFRLAVALLP